MEGPLLPPAIYGGTLGIKPLPLVLSHGFLERGPEYVFPPLSLTRVTCVQAPSRLVFLTLPGLITLDVL
jgi:hypothetical protein